MSDVCERHIEQQANVRVVEGVIDVAPLLAVAHQTICSEQTQVVRAGSFREPRHCGKVADTELSSFQKGKDQPDATGIGENTKDLGHLLKDLGPWKPLEHMNDPLRLHAGDLAASKQSDRGALFDR